MKKLVTILLLFLNSCILIDRNEDPSPIEENLPYKGDSIEIYLTVKSDTSKYLKLAPIYSVDMDGHYIDADSVPMQIGCTGHYKCERLSSTDCWLGHVYYGFYDDKLYLTGKDLSDPNIKAFDVLYLYTTTPKTRGITVITYTVHYDKIVREHR